MAADVAILAYLKRHLDEAGRVSDGLALPDDDRARHGRGWTPGAWDRQLRRDGLTSDTDQARQIARLLAVACRDQSVTNLHALYAAAVESDPLVCYADALIDLLMGQWDRADLLEIGRRLTSTASDREPVKLGITLLGVAGSEADLSVLRVLGAHSEFTHHCVAAVANILPQPDSEVWALARSLRGKETGLAACIEALSGTQDSRIREWLLHLGFIDQMWTDELALIAATTGDLRSALWGEWGEPDREMLTAAGELIEALILANGEIEEYEHAPDVIETYLRYMRTEADTPQDVLTVAVIRSYLVADGFRYGATSTNMGPTAWATAVDTCSWILVSDKWPEVIAKGMDTGDGAAIKAARALNIVPDTIGRIDTDRRDGST